MNLSDFIFVCKFNNNNNNNNNNVLGKGRSKSPQNGQKNNLTFSDIIVIHMIHLLTNEAQPKMKN
jgi:hypothetical protein